MSKNGQLARREGTPPISIAQSPFDLTAMQQMADKIKDLKVFMDKNLEEGTNKDWEYAHIIWKRTLKPGEDQKPTLLDPGTAKIMNFMTVRPRHIIKQEIDTKTMNMRYEVKTEIVPFIPVMYLNPVENRMEQVFPVIAEGVGSSTTREKRYRVRFEFMKERDLKVDGFGEDELQKIQDETPDRVRGESPNRLFYMPTAESLGLDNTLLKMAAKRCLGSTTPLLVKTGKHICRTNASNLYDIYNASSDPVYLPGRSGEWRMITGMIREENRPILSIKLRSGESLRPTEGHEFPISEGKLKFVRELKVGDKFVRSRIVIPTLEGGGADPRYGWAIGLFIAEGEFQADGKAVRFTLHEKETDYIDKLEMIVRTLGGVIQVHPKGNLRCVSVNIYGQAFAGLMSQFVNGNSCYNKTLSKFAWEQGEDFLREVLQGYLDGDSWESDRRKTPKWPLGFTGENYELQHDLRCLCAILGKRVKIIRTNAKIKDHVYSAFRGWITDTVNSYNQAKLEEIESIEPETKLAVVYDIDVDGDDIFLLASGIESHNSEMDAVFQLPGVAGRYSQEIDLDPNRGEEPPAPPAKASAPPQKPQPTEQQRATDKQPPRVESASPEENIPSRYPKVVVENIKLTSKTYNISIVKVVDLIEEEIAKAAGMLTAEAALILVVQKLTDKSQTPQPFKLGGFQVASDINLAPDSFQPCEEAGHIIDYIVENFDQQFSVVRAMVWKEMNAVEPHLTDVEAAKAVQGSFEERSTPPEEAWSKASVEALLGADADRVDITPAGDEVKPKKFLGDLWGPINSKLRPQRFNWVRDSKNSRWVRY